MASTKANCPVVGTTNTTLPPSHPDIDLSKPGQICPVVGATTDHHANLHKHPAVPIPKGRSPSDASACPVISGRLVNEEKSKAMDDDVCPVVGTATTVLPPDHPPTDNKDDEAVCPVTKAKVGHHKGKLHGHPDVSRAGEGAVCPVSGVKV
ncbi:hypothetical protein MYCTH_2308148 [Thermothelomyces thermophilus ATCC 42464]|uniref:Uncharacterized protein n=1 Tax=Thermothelomyces thermophilus (strain ATCC 42464 / BCRC 31852 / DSM 1799) TaxID=573729 RepID=G2QJC6_THET4|nr:uncharacterized protein MYCTH_2308148 [Thermothelomyces thermophilus ATCC 42464]AEO59683.1 hypothetical protein MYCTH_2308148 [Thermothelomyces thermophilus ATCC 42464]